MGRRGSWTSDRLFERSALPFPELQHAILLLELGGRVRRRGCEIDAVDGGPAPRRGAWALPGLALDSKLASRLISLWDRRRDERLHAGEGVTLLTCVLPTDRAPAAVPARAG
jgi:hypothetical protein